MALDLENLTDKLVSHALATGVFEGVNGHEPTNAPSSGGLTCGVWVNDTTAIRSSGLNSTSARVEMAVRVYTNAVTEPMDAIDPAVVGAVDLLCAAYCADFTLGGLVRQVDIFGAYGAGLGARAGYLPLNGITFRVMTITVPLIVNDLWAQGGAAA